MGPASSNGTLAVPLDPATRSTAARTAAAVVAVLALGAFAALRQPGPVVVVSPSPSAVASGPASPATPASAPVDPIAAWGAEVALVEPATLTGVGGYPQELAAGFALNYLANVLAPDALQLLLAHIESLEPARSADDLGCTLGAIPFLDLKSAQRVWTRLRQLEGQAGYQCAVTLAGAAAAHPTFAVQLAKEFATDTALGTDRRGVALQALWLSMHPDRVELFVRLLRDAA